ncbi:MAG TPA: DUF362 domain-containing protein [Candidatus Hydrogenedentes bacterium]|nr:DUF362 domain-containing protein [Candidatus Hydrogenedentota bacterium]
MGFGSDRDRNPEYDEAPMGRREFVRRVGLGAVVAGGLGYLAFAPEDAPFSLRDGSGDRTRFEPKPFRLDDYRVEKPEGMVQDIGIARGDRDGALHFSAEQKRNLLKASLDAIGGIEHYVRAGDVVLVKPNVAYDRPWIFGSTSDPEMLGELIRILYADGKASEVRVADNPIEYAEDCYRSTGIGKAVAAAGGRIIMPNARFFRELNTPGASLIENWSFFATPFDGVDKVIGFCPVKDHALCQASVSIKNWYGLLGGTRNQFHGDVHNVISDFTLMIKPTLTIIDGTRVLAEMGPIASDRRYVRDGNVVMAGLDPVAMDAWAIRHCLDRRDVYPAYLDLAVAKGGGRMDWEGRIKEIGSGVALG